MSITCDFIDMQLACKLPKQMMDVLLKIRTKTWEHTFREDVYTCTLKYHRWNNQLKPFRSLKRRVANIFRKRNSFSDDSRGTSMQSIVNHMERDSEERSVVGDNKRNSTHSDWSDLILIDEEAEYRIIYKSRKRPDTTTCTATTLTASTTKTATIPPTCPAKRTVKNIVLVPYTPRPKEWGSWQVRSPYASSTVVNPHTVHEQELDQEQKEEELGREEEEGELAYKPHSPYYSPVQPPEFYEDE